MPVELFKKITFSQYTCKLQYLEFNLIAETEGPFPF